MINWVKKVVEAKIIVYALKMMELKNDCDEIMNCSVVVLMVFFRIDFRDDIFLLWVGRIALTVEK